MASPQTNINSYTPESTSTNDFIKRKRDQETQQYEKRLRFDSKPNDSDRMLDEDQEDQEDQDQEVQEDQEDKEDQDDQEDQEDQEQEHQVRFALLKLIETKHQNGTNTVFPLTKEIEGELKVNGGNTIGSRKWDINSNANHIYLDDMLIDSIHCKVRVIQMKNGEQKVVIIDGTKEKPSRSGTHVDGCMISNKKYTTLELGQIVKLGCKDMVSTSSSTTSTPTSTPTSGPDRTPCPEYQLIDLEDNTSSSSSLHQIQNSWIDDIKSIVSMSKSALRLSNDERDQSHLNKFHIEMEKASF